MAQELLVDDLIDDGQRIIDQFLTDGIDVAVGFWATSDETSWRLYIASPAFDDHDPGAAANLVYDSVGKVPDLTISPALDLFAINDQNPAARAALKIAGRPGKKEGTRYRGSRLGNLPIEEAYIYPKPEIPVRQAFIVTCVRDDQTGRWSASTKKAEYYRSLRPKGAVSYSTAQWLGAKGGEEKFAHVYVLVEVDPLLDERTIATNPVILQTLVEQAQAMADEMFKAKHPDAMIEHQPLVMNLV
jgi:hypothetical protein